MPRPTRHHSGDSDRVLFGPYLGWRGHDLHTPSSKRYIKGMIVTSLAVAGKKGKVEKGRALPSSRHPWMRSDFTICASGVRAEGEKCGSPRGLRCG
jgi:hypothetical protein